MADVKNSPRTEPGRKLQQPWCGGWRLVAIGSVLPNDMSMMMMVVMMVSSASDGQLHHDLGNRRQPAAASIPRTHGDVDDRRRSAGGSWRPGQRPVIGGNAVGGLGTPRNEMAAHTASEPDVTPDLVYTQSPSCMRCGSSNYDQYPRGAVAACDPEA